MNEKNLGLRTLRFMRSFSQSELAAKSGVDQSSISKAENGLPASREVRRKIAAALEMSEHELFPKKD